MLTEECYSILLYVYNIYQPIFVAKNREIL